MRTSILFLFAIVFALSATNTLAAPEPRGSKPNIVFVLADDMGWAQPGFNGGKASLTPNMDALAAEGMRLNDYYTHSVCAPTRAAFLTGRYAFRTWSDWRSEDFGKPSYLAKLGLELAHTKSGEETRMPRNLAAQSRTSSSSLPTTWDGLSRASMEERHR